MQCSLVLLYSTDRISQLERSLDLWCDVRGYSAAEKILCVDGETNIRPPGWIVLEIPRIGPHYCWAHTLNQAVTATNASFVFYFDADRIVQDDYLERSLAVLENSDVFTFAPYLFSVQGDATIDQLRIMRDDPFTPIYRKKLLADHRVFDPTQLGRKNPFAGGVGFRRDTFLRYGGFDPRYVGWGYPDYDFFMCVHSQNPHAMHPLSDAIELHQHHGYCATQRELSLQNLWNCRQYVEKWNIQTAYLEDCRRHLKVSGVLYSAVTMDEFLQHELGHGQPVAASA